MDNHKNAADHRIITAAIDFIAKEQLPDGRFLHLSDANKNDLSQGIKQSSTFFPSIIASSLSVVGTLPDLPITAKNNLRAIQAKAAKFLLGEKSAHWSFNYWTRAARHQDPSLPSYPDDLDDTFNALAALATYDPSIIDGQALASILTLLTALETAEGGPYRTWLATENTSVPAAIEKADIVVNSTIGYFLSLIKVRLPKLEQFIDGRLKNADGLGSPYYAGICQAAYFISRLRPDGNIAQLLNAHFLQNQTIVSPLEKALAAIAYLRAGDTSAATDAISALALDAQQFIAYPFSIDPKMNGTRSYAGCSALTAAIIAEALATRLLFHGKDKMSFENRRHEKIQKMAIQECADVGPKLFKIAAIAIKNVDDEKITRLPYDFQCALRQKNIVIPEHIVEWLALGNLYGWAAYGIYDDLLDGDDDNGGNRSSLLSANLFLRNISYIYCAGLKEKIPDAPLLFRTLMNEVDNANAWEMSQCRILGSPRGIDPAKLPNFGNGAGAGLSSRSIGHAMGPLAELLFAGHSMRSDEYKNTLLFFRNYLASRQLHDDAHDWEEDLAHGRLTLVSTMLISQFAKKYPKGGLIDVQRSLPLLRKLFWEEIIDEVVRAIVARITMAREARDHSVLLAGSGFMENALGSLYTAARKALDERDKMLDFLKFCGPFDAIGKNA